MLRIDDKEGAVIVAFEGREVVYPFGELDTLVPAYATTIHKSQGSEYPAVVIATRDAALDDAGEEPPLHRGGARQAPRRADRPAQGHRLAVRGGNMKPRWTRIDR